MSKDWSPNCPHHHGLDSPGLKGRDIEPWYGSATGPPRDAQSPSTSMTTAASLLSQERHTELWRTRSIHDLFNFHSYFWNTPGWRLIRNHLEITLEGPFWAGLWTSLEHRVRGLDHWRLIILCERRNHGYTQIWSQLKGQVMVVGGRRGKEGTIICICMVFEGLLRVRGWRGKEASPALGRITIKMCSTHAASSDSILPCNTNHFSVLVTLALFSQPSLLSETILLVSWVPF